MDKYSGVSIAVALHGDENPRQINSSAEIEDRRADAHLRDPERHPLLFYLFDELDAALDSQYHTAVANLIARSYDRA